MCSSRAFGGSLVSWDESSTSIKGRCLWQPPVVGGKIWLRLVGDWWDIFNLSAPSPKIQ